jgi:hypothetical protein
MDDRELEARLRTRLHARFDDTPVPAELASNVRQALATPAPRVRFDVRSRGRLAGWAVVGAIAVVAVVAVVGGNLMGLPGPGDTPTQAPSATVAAGRDFIVLPPEGAPVEGLSQPSPSDVQPILLDRLHALQVGNVASEFGNAIWFMVPAAGPADEEIRAVLGATGDVEFVPLPPEDYPDLGSSLIIGEPLPIDEPALFGWEGIASVVVDETRQSPAFTVTLTPAAGAALADYTAAHVGEAMAIVLDGRVASVPTINEPIPGGQITISGGMSTDAGRFARLRAILVGGRLPEAWHGARVPAIVSREFAINAARGQFPRSTFKSASLAAELDGEAWRAVWYVDVTGDVGSQVFPCPTRGPSGDTCPSPGLDRRVAIDAVRGNVLYIQYPPD